MIIGFTGTRYGMNERQIRKVREYLSTHDISGVRHGACVGADQDFHNICVQQDVVIHVHPGYSKNNPEDDRWRAILEGGYLEYEAKPYFTRNRDIVDNCDILLATPFSPDNGKGGTWYTVNYAKKVGKKVIVFER